MYEKFVGKWDAFRKKEERQKGKYIFACQIVY